MIKGRILIACTLVLSAVLFTSACKKDDPKEEEFVADDNTFANFSSWSLDATAQGPDPALGGMAHGGNDSTVTRNVYFKDGQNPVGGKYPKGTVIVKHSTDPSLTINEVTAMVKRGGEFNVDGNGWEWFMLTPAGNIATDGSGTLMRGANLMNGMCQGCHSAASTKDFVFSK